MRQIWKRVLWGLILGGAIGLTLAVYLFNKPNRSMDRLTPDFELSASVLMKEYQDSEATANEIYLGKIVLIDGTVKMINRSKDGSISLSLNDSFEGVTATFSAKYVSEKGIDEIEVGEKISLKGRCDGKLTDVRISDCVIVD